MNKLEKKVYQLVNEWCENQKPAIPDANRRALMDEVCGLLVTRKKANKPKPPIGCGRVIKYT